MHLAVAGEHRVEFHRLAIADLEHGADREGEVARAIADRLGLDRDVGEPRLEGVELEIRPNALKAIARKALARKTGARGLRSIMEQSLIDTMFDLPNASNVEKVVVDESTIEENKPPLLVYREAAKKA